MPECLNDDHEIGCECGASEWLAYPINLLDGTTEFMRLAEQLGDEIDWSTTSFDDPNRELRRNMLREEIKEYFDTEAINDPVEMIDGLLDIIVIAWGSVIRYVGEDKGEAAAFEVMRSNLSKVDGSLGPIQRRDDGKILKPPGWTPPDIAGAIHAS